MAANDPLRDLELLIRSRYCVIFLETEEEDRAETLVRYVAERMWLPSFTWTSTKGLRRSGVEGAVYATNDLGQALAHIENSPTFSAIYLFHGIAPHLDDALLVEKLKDAASNFNRRTGAIIVLGRALQVPESLKPISAVLRMPPAGIEEYRSLLQKTLRDLSAREPIKVEMSPEDMDRLLMNLRGLTLVETQKVLTKAIIEDGRLSREDIQAVIEAKKAIVESEGLLEYTPAEERMKDIADLAGLKDWLAKRRWFLTEPEKAVRFGLSFPKGVLLLGVQGCGKSLCAKAVAMEWGLPLLKLDPSNLYNKYIGESERNFKRAIAMAEKMAPVVLWIDEIEKAFAASGETVDGGVSQRILGTFLSWLQDRRGDVFVVATANDIARLPPEFIRKGRFDEVFFVDLPDAGARKAIFEIHLRRRGHPPAEFDLEGLASAAEGFSGSEIEQVVISALYTAFSSGEEFGTGIIREEIARTRPLSETMAEKVAALREWARERTVSAG